MKDMKKRKAEQDNNNSQQSKALVVTTNAAEEEQRRKKMRFRGDFASQAKIDNEEGFRYNELLPNWQNIKDDAKKEAAYLCEYIKSTLREIVDACAKARVPGVNHRVGSLENFEYLQDKTYSIMHTLDNYLDLDYPLSISDKEELTTLLYDIFIQENDFDSAIKTKACRLIGYIIRERDLDKLKLKFDWRPLYEMIRVYLNSSIRRNPVMPVPASSIVTLVRKIRRFFPDNANAEMMEEFRPHLCPHDHIIHQYSGFMELFITTHLTGQVEQGSTAEPDWMGEFFAMWDWIVFYPSWDYTFTSIFARLAEDRAGYINWEPHLPLLFTHVVRCLDLPVGSPPPVSLYNCLPPDEIGIFTSLDCIRESLMERCAQLIVWMMSPSSNTLDSLKRLMKSMKSFYHPSNGGEWTPYIGLFMFNLSKYMTRRLVIETRKERLAPIPGSFKINGTDQVKEFVQMMVPIALTAMYSKSSRMSVYAYQTLKHLAYIAPEIVFPPLMEQVFHALSTLTETHQTVAAIDCMCALIFPLLNRDLYPEGANYLGDLLSLTLPGIDIADINKTKSTLKFYSSLLVCVPMFAEAATPNVPKSNDMELSDAPPLAVQFFEDWCIQFMDRIFVVLSHQHAPTGETQSEDGDGFSAKLFSATIYIFFMQLSGNLYNLCLNKLMNFVKSEFSTAAIKNVGHMCAAASYANPAVALAHFIPFCYEKLIVDTDGKPENLTETELRWYLYILSQAVYKAGSSLLKYRKEITTILKKVWGNQEKKTMKAAGKLLKNLLRSLTLLYPTDMRSVNPDQWQSEEFKNASWTTWGEYYTFKDIKLDWHEPSDEELLFAVELVNTFIEEPYNRIVKYAENVKANSQAISTSKRERTNAKKELRNDLLRLRYIMRGASTLIPEIESDNSPEMQTRTNKFFGDIAINAGLSSVRIKSIPGASLNHSRSDVCLLLHELATVLMKYREDEPQLLSCLSKVIAPIIAVRETTRSAIKSKLEAHEIVKLYNFKTFKDKHLYPRYVLAKRVVYQYQYRLAMHNGVIPYTKEYALLFQDLVDLSLSEYSQVRRKAQGIFVNCLKKFAPVTFKEFLPQLIEKLEEKDISDSARTGAIYILRSSSAVRRVTSDWDLLGQLMLAVCQTSHIEKDSVQNRVDQLFDTYADSIYEITFGWLEQGANTNLRIQKYEKLVKDLVSVFYNNTKRADQEHGASASSSRPETPQPFTSSLHWKYQVMVFSCLGVLIRTDKLFPLDASRVFFQGLISDLDHIRDISCEAVSVILAQYKPVQTRVALRVDKALEHIDANAPASARQAHSRFMHELTVPKTKEEWERTFFFEKNYFGWNRLPSSVNVYLYGNTKPDAQFLAKPKAPSPYTFNKNKALIGVESMDQERSKFVNEIKDMLSPEFIKKFTELLALKEEQFGDNLAQMFKGFFQVFDNFLDLCTPALEALLSHAGSGKPEERGHITVAVEIIAGLVRATKHWEYSRIQKVHAYLIPLMKDGMNNCSQDCVDEWVECIQFCVFDRDTRRCTWLLDFLMSNINLETGTSAAQARSVTYLFAVLSEMTWRERKTISRVLEILSNYLDHPYQQVRDGIGAFLSLIFQFFWDPQRDPITLLPVLNNEPISEAIEHKDVATKVLDEFLNKAVAKYHELREQRNQQQQQQGATQDKKSTPKKAKESKDEEVPRTPTSATSDKETSFTIQEGDSSFEEIPEDLMDEVVMEEGAETEEKPEEAPSNMDDAEDKLKSFSKTIISFVYGVFSCGVGTPFGVPYVKQIIPLLALMLQDSTDDELVEYSKECFGAISYAAFPAPSVKTVIQIILDTIESIDSWRVKSAMIVFLQTFAFRHQFFLQESQEILFERLLALLEDTQVEVRDLAAMSLAGFVKMTGDDTLIENLSKRFQQMANTKIQRGKTKATDKNMLKRHGGVLGLSALVLAFPYEVPDFMPAILVSLADHANDPTPIQTTVRNAFAEFWKTHRDMWHLHKEKFSEEQNLVLSDLLISPSYYA